MTYTVPESLENTRLDKAVATLSELSRTRCRRIIEAGGVQMDGVVIKDPAFIVTVDACIQVEMPPVQEADPLPEDIPLDVVYEDTDIIVLNKPPGLVVHPGAGNPSGTLVNALLAHAGDSLSGIGGVKRPGIVHRLDKDTSGLMVVAKNDAAHQGLVAQFQDRALKRTYVAVVLGCPNPVNDSIEGAIGRHPTQRQKMSVRKSGGKEATTHYITQETFAPPSAMPFASQVECTLETGRTHQIRVHMAHRGHPLIGDPVYGRQRENKVLDRLLSENPDISWDNSRQALHARALKFLHPITNKKLKFQAAIPDDMQSLLDVLVALKNGA